MRQERNLLHGNYATGHTGHVNMNLRNPYKIRTWNVRGRLETRKLKVINGELIRYDIAIAVG